MNEIKDKINYIRDTIQGFSLYIKYDLKDLSQTTDYEENLSSDE